MQEAIPLRRNLKVACLILCGLIVIAGSAAAANRSAPSATTGTATNVSTSAATLTGSVNPNGSSTSYYFEYGTSTSYGTHTSTGTLSKLHSTRQLQASATGLAAGATYHFRLVATNNYGTSYGSDATFTTPGSTSAPPPPPPPPPPSTPPPPTASFTYSPSYPVTGSPVSFDGTQSTCSATPCSYTWIDTAGNATLGTGAQITFTFQLAGTKYVQLTVTDANAASSSIEHDVIVTAPAPAPAPSPSGPLTWQPPTCGDATHGCVDMYLSNTGSHQNPSLSAANDYRIHLPMTGPLKGGITISGGHNVQIIGGEIDMTYPCSDSSSACHGVNISRGSASGQVYIEGVYIKNPDPNYLTDTYDTGDGIDVDDYPGVTDIVLQNVRIEGIKGCDPAVPSAHADVFQPYNAGGANMNIDRLTGTTDCQGMQVDPDYAYATYGLLPKSGTFKNVNINVFANPSSGNGNRYAAWFTYATNSCVSYPIILSNFYVQEPGGTLAYNSVWPDPANSYPSACLGLYPGGYVYWPNLTSLSGSVTNGLPPGGDFVPAGTAGVGYVSPGYQ
jgi:hypothetical protein